MEPGYTRAPTSHKLEGTKPQHGQGHATPNQSLETQKHARLIIQSFDADLIVHPGPGRGGRRQLSNPVSLPSCKCQLAKLLPPYLWPVLSWASANLSRASESAPAVVVTLPPRCYYKRDSYVGGCTGLRSVFVCVFVRAARSVD